MSVKKELLKVYNLYVVEKIKQPGGEGGVCKA